MPRGDSFQENSEKLYKILLSQIISNNSDYSKLIIIPDGILNHLPFELLSKTENIDSRIIYSKSILYNYTASKIYNKGKKIKSKQKFLGIAPTYSNNQFANLPYAKKEIRQISESWDGHILEDEDANLENFKTSSKNYNIVHIAGHTEINDSFPLQSRLVFSELADSVESLYAHELYNMKFDLDMVALSACNTGIGKLRKGEGNMSLARGFAYAGCPSTVTTLWPMVDEPTKDIMTLFYGNLKKGQTKSEALRNAKLTFLETGGPKIQDPIYWSGIVIIGSDIPLVGTCFMNSTRFYIFLTLGTLLIVLFMLKKFRK